MLKPVHKFLSLPARLNRLRERSPLPSSPYALAQEPHTSPIRGQAIESFYQTSPWLYLAVNRIAEAGALVPLSVKKRSAKGLIDQPNHPFIRLLESPNPLLSRFELMEQTLGFLELKGNAYWYLLGNADGLPAEIWPLRPDRVRIVPAEQHGIQAYLYEIEGQSVALDPLEVIHFKRWHPANDYYGLSALSAGQLALRSDQAMAEWNANTFGQDRGIPAGILSISDFISDGDFERLKREWKQTHGGTSRRTAFMRGGRLSWQNIGLNHQELDYLKGRQAHRDEILNLFGIPIGLISENATEANARVAERQFIEHTLYPKLLRLGAKITRDMMPFYGADLVMEFEDIRPGRQEARLQELARASPFMSINEIRSRYFHMPPLTWGDGPATAPPDQEQIP